MQSAPETLILIPGAELATVDVIGAKARSLQQIAACGLLVPPAFVLSTRFFQPWIDMLRGLSCWTAWQDSEPGQWAALCEEIKANALSLPWSEAQRQVLDTLHARVVQCVPAQRFAVRSSAPDEDLATASFAGLYETELGVSAAGLEDAIRRCFAACLDYRVFVYKAAHHMDLTQPSLALIVQEQVDSDVAGVGFSINPLTNDYDESAFDANWGLGESVVSGIATPDHFVLDKTSGAIKERHLGAKQYSVALARDTGTHTEPHRRRAEFCLDAAQLCELNAALARLEAEYGYPVDMEWAYAKDKLFILQARAITAYVPLAPEMLSAPGTRRALYMDIALSKGMTSNAPISPLGLSWLEGDMALMLRHCIGHAAFDFGAPGGLVYLGGARMYMNLSKLLWFSSPAQLAKGNAATDRLMADTIAAIDAASYRSERRPPWIWPAVRMLPGALWRLRRAMWRTLRSVMAPDSTYRLFQRDTAAFEAAYSGAFDNSLPLDAFQRRYGAPAIAHVIEVDMPALAVGVLAVGAARGLASKRSAEEQALAEQLARGISGNVVVDMGIRMFSMAKMLGAAAFDDLSELAARVERRQLPDDFLSAWDQFMAQYGCRGPGEMDLATPHYADDPMTVLRQMSSMTADAGGFDPEECHRRLARQREQAYQSLMQRFGWLRRWALRRSDRLIALFGGLRDTPKLHNLMYQYAARRRLLAEGDLLVAGGRLDAADQVFNLRVTDLMAASTDRTLDLRALSTQRGAFNRLLASHVHTFPAVIDSRGRISRPPPRAEKPGELSGMAVAPGVVTGPVKILHNAHEKIIEKGDILVAFTTDPGWTPLFVNAAAVVLEVGGVLQHGAVVAREYGKPCVAGIADVLTRLSDGQLVEVDGTAGVVRIISARSPLYAPPKGELRADDERLINS